MRAWGRNDSPALLHPAALRIVTDAGTAVVHNEALGNVLCDALAQIILNQRQCQVNAAVTPADVQILPCLMKMRRSPPGCPVALRELFGFDPVRRARRPSTGPLPRECKCRADTGDPAPRREADCTKLRMRGSSAARSAPLPPATIRVSNALMSVRPLASMATQMSSVRSGARGDHVCSVSCSPACPVGNFQRTNRTSCIQQQKSPQTQGSRRPAAFHSNDFFSENMSFRP